jgi:hypothetical protein
LNREQQLKAFASVLRKLVFAPQAKPEENSAKIAYAQKIVLPRQNYDNTVFSSCQEISFF